jgi:acylphosphatase
VSAAFRAVVGGDVHGVGFREATVERARELGVLGWVRIHAEGEPAALEALAAFLREGPPQAAVAEVAVDPVAVEGHEQFAIRGVAAGMFEVQEQAHGFELRLQVGGAMRVWAVPKGPSMDPAVKRFAVELPAGEEPVTVWDRGTYEQGGRVPWPAALERGHAVFVLHGAKLRGGFALQRTRTGERPQWLLVKRRDEHARPGSDVVAEHGARGAADDASVARPERDVGPR